MEAAEEGLFKRSPKLAAGDQQVRLACCLLVRGPVTVLKTGVRSK
jgi:hypothetical protein